MSEASTKPGTQAGAQGGAAASPHGGGDPRASHASSAASARQDSRYSASARNARAEVPAQPTLPLIDFHLEDILPILRKQQQVILLFLGTVLITTLVLSLLRTPEYRATATLRLQPRAGQEVNVNEVVDYQTRGYFEVQQFNRTMIQIMLSRTVRDEVVRRYEALGYDDLLVEDGGADKLTGMMTVLPAEQSQLVSVSVSHTDPERAAVLANLVAEAFSDQNLAGRRDASKSATDWLDGQLVEVEQTVRDTRARLFTFKESTSTVDVAERMNTLAAQLTALNEAYGQKSTALVLKRTTLQSHEALFKEGAAEELAKVMSSPLLDAAARDLAAATAQHADIGARYGPKHPEFLQSKARLDALNDTMIAEVRRLLDAERAATKVLDAETSSLDATIKEVKTKMLEYQRVTAEHDAVLADLERAEKLYERLSERLEEVRLTARTQLNNVDIVDRAVVPTSPYKPKIPMAMGVALLIGLFGGVGLALLREYVDDTITSPLDVTAHLRVPFLGLVPRLPDGVSPAEADLFTHFNPRSSIAEAVRGLRAMIEMNPAGPSPRRILVTSSIAREGKTSTTMRIAVSFAQMGRRVVVIDADLRRPRIHKIFGADNAVGLSSYLVGTADVDDLPNATEVPGLFCIWSGAATDHPAELMASERMESLLSKLEEVFDIILIDTPPSVALSDAVTLSHRVDGTLLVVKEQTVSRSVVKQTVDTLLRVEANVIGVILNNVDLQRSGTRYKYYYAYRDYYSTYGAELPPADPGKAAK